jgi:hypothetical protein
MKDHSDANPGNPAPARVAKSSWWRSFLSALGSSLVAVVLLWTAAAVTAGVPVPMAGHDAHGFGELDGALLGLLFYLLMIPPLPLMIVVLAAITAATSVRRYPFAPVKARRLALFQAFLATVIFGGICLPVFVGLMRAS